MHKFEFEYPLNTSPKVLYTMLSTPSGLADWFADNVNINKDIFIFKWNDSIDRAKVLLQKENSCMRFKWLSDTDDKSYFELRIDRDELTKDVALIVTDFAEESDHDDLKELWDSQIAKLKHILGL